VLTASLCIERGPLVKALSLKPLMEIGQISYSIYLLHLPVYWLLLMAWPDLKPWALFILGTGLTWLLSMIMHYSIDQLRTREWRASRAIPLFTAGALVVGCSAYYLPTYVADSMRPGGKRLVLTLGDSMAEDFATALSKHGNRFAVVDGGQGGCGVMSPDKVRDKVGKMLVNWDACRRWETFWKDQLQNAGPDAVLIHVGWDAAEQNTHGTWVTSCDPAYRTRYLKQLAVATDLIRKEAPQAQILLMNERRENGAINPVWGSCFNKVVDQYARKATTNVHLIDLDAFLCPHGQCQQYTPTGLRLYPDGDGVHLTNAGMSYVEPWLEKQISAALGAGAAKNN
jgi:lysophospholipase L1-like esterase